MRRKTKGNYKECRTGKNNAFGTIENLGEFVTTDWKQQAKIIKKNKTSKKSSFKGE